MFFVVRNSSAETKPIWTTDWECQTLILWRLIPSELLSRTGSSFSILESCVSAACTFSQPFFSCKNNLTKSCWAHSCPWRPLVVEEAISQSQAVLLYFSPQQLYLENAAEQLAEDTWFSEHNCTDTVGWHDCMQHPSLHWCCLFIRYCCSSLGLSSCLPNEWCLSRAPVTGAATDSTQSMGSEDESSQMMGFAEGTTGAQSRALSQNL